MTSAIDKLASGAARLSRPVQRLLKTVANDGTAVFTLGDWEGRGSIVRDGLRQTLGELRQQSRIARQLVNGAGQSPYSPVLHRSRRS